VAGCATLTHPPCDSNPVHWNHSWKVNGKSMRFTTIKTLLYPVYYGLRWHSNLCIIPILPRDSRLVSRSQKRKHPHFWRERLQIHDVIHKHYTAEPALFCHSSTDIMIHSQQSEEGHRTCKHPTTYMHASLSVLPFWLPCFSIFSTWSQPTADWSWRSVCMPYLPPNPLA